MYLTAQDYIKMSMRELGVIAHGESLTDEELQDNLQTLNIMLSSWAAEEIVHQAIVKESFTLSYASATYTIGQDQTFNTVKPISIKIAKITDSNSYDYPIYLKDVFYFESITNKTLKGRPKILYYDPGITQPNGEIGKIYLYPQRDITYTLTIHSQKPFTEFTGLTAQFDFPQYMERAIKFNLAAELASGYGKSISPKLEKLAEDSLNVLHRVNIKNNDIIFDFNYRGKGNTYNIKTG